MTTLTLKLQHRLICYGGIGATAAAVHLSIVFLLVRAGYCSALIANVFAFIIAFNFSFFGHKFLTFAKLEDQKSLRLPHFFLVALSAGVLNEIVYFLVLRYTHLNYLTALILVLGLVSVYSFILSRYWACR